MATTPPSWLLSIPPATRALTGALIVFSLTLSLLRWNIAPTDLSSVFRGGADSSLAFKWLVVVPGSVVWYPWTLLTAAFCEVNIVEFLVSVFSLVLSGRYLERVWGQVELLKFVIVVVVASNIGCVAVNLAEYGVGVSALGTEGQRGEDLGKILYGVSYHGLMALQTGFLVAFTQLIPEHQVQIFGGLVKLRVKQLPMLYVLVSNIACVIGYQSPYLLIQLGWLVSWFYLRFIKWSEGGEFRGDRSETFSFASWFPPFLHKPITILSTFAFSLAVRLHLLQPWNSTDLETGGSHYSSTSGVPGGARAEAERRRAMALKALDQRMASSSGSNTTPSSNPTAKPTPALQRPVPAATATSTAEKAAVVFDAGGEVDERKDGEDGKVKD